MTCRKTIKNRLKGVLAGAILMLFSPSVLCAQEARYGLKAGLNYTTIIGDLTDGINPRLSGHLGLFVNLEFSDGFAIRPELLYSSQGFRFNTDLAAIQSTDPQINETDFTTAVALNYLSLPIMVQFDLNDRLSVEFGPQFAFLLNQVTKIKKFDGLDLQNLNQRESVPGNFELDYGAAVGLSVEISQAISISPRLYLGLRNRLNGTLTDAQNFNGMVQLSANYAFR